MFNGFERLVAWRYLRSRRREGFISVIAIFSLLGIALGVATLIVVMAVMNGFRAELLGRILGLNGHANIEGSGGAPVALYGLVTEQARGTDGVTAAFPVIEGQALLSHRGVANGVVIRGMLAEDMMAKPLFGEAITGGSLGDLGEDGIAIGHRLASALQLRVGDALNLISPQGNPTPFGTIPRAKAFRIGAVFDVGTFEYDSSFVFMPLGTAQAFFRMGGEVSRIEVFTQDPDDMNDAIRNLAGEVREGHQIIPWQRVNGSFFAALQVERNVMFLILTLMIVVAAFNIISGLIMLVKDKSRDIAILRTIGASRGAVLRVFLMTGTFLGAFGTLGGLGLGVLITANLPAIQVWLEQFTGMTVWDPTIRFLTRIPAEIDWREVAAVTAMSMILSFLATLYPAWRAARLDPVEALRYE